MLKFRYQISWRHKDGPYSLERRPWWRFWKWDVLSTHSDLVDAYNAHVDDFAKMRYGKIL